MNPELIRIVDGIARDKNIEREQIYTNIEQAIASALRKQFNVEETNEFDVKLDRITGDISANRQGEALPLSILGRIAAQTAKQVMIQLIRQDERGSIYEEYKDRVGTIITGTVARFEGPTLIISLGRSEGIMPRSEQIPGENHDVGERIQALILEVRDTPSAIKIILSRSHPEFIRKLFEREVPEVGEKTIELKALAREPGHRTKIAVSSIDSKVDAVGACVGVRGSRIKNIVDELGGEKIDIVRWNESSQILISNALKPAEVTEVSLCFDLGRATVVVNEDQLSLAIGKRGQNVRLAARLTGWDVDILTPAEFQAGVKRLDTILKSIEGVSQEHVDKVVALGLIDVRDIEEVGQEPLDRARLPEEVADKVVEALCRRGEDCRRRASRQERSRRKSRRLTPRPTATDSWLPCAAATLYSAAGRRSRSRLRSIHARPHGIRCRRITRDHGSQRAGSAPPAMTFLQKKRRFPGIGTRPMRPHKVIPDEDDDTAALAEGRLASAAGQRQE